MDWNALKVFLSVVEYGSLTAAARSLKVSQPTLSRKLVNLEESLDSQLFQRLPRGLTLTEAGESILKSVRQMEGQALEVEKRLTGQNHRLEGKVRLTTTEYIGNYWITEEMDGFRKQFPGINVDLHVDMNVIDLIRREADIAVRLGRPTQPDLIAKKLGSFSNYLAAHKDYLNQYGAPEKLDDLKHHLAIGYDQAIMLHSAIHNLFSHFHKENIIFYSNSLIGINEAVNRGLGIGLMPDFAVTHYPDIQFILQDHYQLTIEVWLVTHADIQHNARIRALYDYLATNLSQRLKSNKHTQPPTMPIGEYKNHPII